LLHLPYVPADDADDNGNQRIELVDDGNQANFGLPVNKSGDLKQLYDAEQAQM